tara:strand:+ start:248 stop:829 length:582 start_codon:yes stop_codon:yes gene_type:complete
MVQVVNPLENAVLLLQDFGFFSVILPFILVYALIFGLLTNIKLFGSDDSSKTVNQVIALSVGAFVITSTDAVNNLAAIIPQAGFLLVVSLLLLMVLGIFGFTSTFDSLLGKELTFSRQIVALIIVTVFLLIIDAGLETGIPLIRPFSEFLVGQSALISGEAFGTVAALALLLGFPLAIIYLLGKSTTSKSSDD